MSYWNSRQLQAKFPVFLRDNKENNSESYYRLQRSKVSSIHFRFIFNKFDFRTISLWNTLLI